MPCRQRVHPAMGEREERAAQPERREHGGVGDGAEREDRAEPGQAAISAARKRRHVAISPGSGLFCGGTQRTALVMRAR